jgi:hypothetical protein
MKDPFTHEVAAAQTLALVTRRTYDAVLNERTETSSFSTVTFNTLPADSQQPPPRVSDFSPAAKRRL